jgi:hypothetical protein
VVAALLCCEGSIARGGPINASVSLGTNRRWGVETARVIRDRATIEATVVARAGFALDLVGQHYLAPHGDGDCPDEKEGYKRESLDTKLAPTVAKRRGHRRQGWWLRIHQWPLGSEKQVGSMGRPPGGACGAGWHVAPLSFRSVRVFLSCQARLTTTTNQAGQGLSLINFYSFVPHSKQIISSLLHRTGYRRCPRSRARGLLQPLFQSRIRWIQLQPTAQLGQRLLFFASSGKQISECQIQLRRVGL